jgi:outer membrane protein TolC
VSARETAGQRRSTEAGRAGADTWWAAPPSLQLSHRDDRLQSSAGRRETEVGVTVPLWLPGQRAARVASAEAAVALAVAAEPVLRLRLAGEVRDAAWRIAALQAEQGQVDAQEQELRQLADDVERRVRAGDLARADALAAQAERMATAAQQLDVRQRMQAARRQWTLLTGLTAAPDRQVMEAGVEAVAAAPAAVASSAAASETATGAPAPEMKAGASAADRAPAPAEATAARLAEHPELALASQVTALARKRLELLQHSRRDAPELTVGLRQDTPGRGDKTLGSLAVGLRLPFGGDARNLPLEAVARAELDTAQAVEQQLRERLDIDAAAARDLLLSTQAQLDVEITRARMLRDRAALIDKSFKAGETPLPDLLRARAVAAQAESAAARQSAALGQARARLQQTLGLLP